MPIFSLFLLTDSVLYTVLYTYTCITIQIALVFGPYLVDYYQKESTHLKLRYGQSLIECTAVLNLPAKKAVTTTTIMSALPTVKAERFKTISNIARTIGNHEYVDIIFSLTNESIMRMGIIGQDDKKLPFKIKDLFLLHIKFLIDCVLLPSTSAMITMLLKLAAASSQSSTLPPIEFLTVLGAAMTVSTYCILCMYISCVCYIMCRLYIVCMLYIACKLYIALCYIYYILCVYREYM